MRSRRLETGAAIADFAGYPFDQTQARLVQSEVEAKSALRLGPDNVDAELALGLHHQILGEIAAAQPYLDRARELDPHNPKVLIAVRTGPSRMAGDAAPVGQK